MGCGLIPRVAACAIARNIRVIDRDLHVERGSTAVACAAICTGRYRHMRRPRTDRCGELTIVAGITTQGAN